MPARDVLNNDIQATGNVWFTGTVTLPASTVTDDMISAAADISKDKLDKHQFAVQHSTVTGSNIAAQTYIIHAAYKAGTIVAFEAALNAACTSSDTVTVDLKKSTGGGALASVLSAAIQFAAADAALTVKAATISSAAYIDGDLLAVVVTVSGGSSGQGLIATTTLAEQPA